MHNGRRRMCCKGECSTSRNIYNIWNGYIWSRMWNSISWQSSCRGWKLCGFIWLWKNKRSWFKRCKDRTAQFKGKTWIRKRKQWQGNGGNTFRNRHNILCTAWYGRQYAWGNIKCYNMETDKWGNFWIQTKGHKHIWCTNRNIWRDSVCWYRHGYIWSCR